MLYATIASEKGIKQIGASEHIEAQFFITREREANMRVRVINDKPMGLIYVSVEEYFMGKWRMKYETKYFTNKTK